jgi:hypothetical protein
VIGRSESAIHRRQGSLHIPDIPQNFAQQGAGLEGDDFGLRFHGGLFTERCQFRGAGELSAVELIAR